MFTPYGAQLVANGNSIGQYTAKGFTGQYADTVSGLDYYVSRYYDLVAGVFLSADALDGNLLGMNPYGYVGNNPETETDPTGQYFAPPGNGNGGTPSCAQLRTCGSGNSSGYGSGSGGKFSTPFYNQPSFGKTNGQQNSNQNSCGGSSQADCTGATALVSVPYEGETTVSVQVGGTPGVFCFGVCVTTFSGGVTVQVSIPVSGTAAVTAEVCTTPLSCIATHGGVDSNPIDDAQALDMDAGDTPARPSVRAVVSR